MIRHVQYIIVVLGHQTTIFFFGIHINLIVFQTEDQGYFEIILEGKGPIRLIRVAFTETVAVVANRGSFALPNRLASRHVILDRKHNRLHP